MNRSALLTLSLVLSLSFVAPASAAPANAEQAPDGALAALGSLLDSGRIDEATRGLYILYLLKDPSRLPAELRLPLEPGLASLTPLVLDALRSVRSGPPALRDEARRLLADPPTTAGFVESADHSLRLHYQEEGDAVFAARLLEVAEVGYRALVEDQGWAMPWGLEDGEPTPRLDVYFVDTAYGYSGHCAPLGDNPLTSWTDTLVRCEIDRSNPREYLDETLLHEMIHAFQMSEDVLEFGAAFEMFCVHTVNVMLRDNWEWMYFVPAFQETPHYAIFLWNLSNQLYHYGSALFAQFLDERYGRGDGALAPALWRAARQDGTVWMDSDGWVSSTTRNEPDLFDAIEAYLRSEHDATLDDALVEFAEWRLVLGRDDDGRHFARGASWVGAEPAMGASFDASELPVVDHEARLPPLPTGTSYIEVETDRVEGPAELRATFALGAGTRWAVQAFRFGGAGGPEVFRAEVADGRAEVRLPVEGVRRVVLGVTNLGLEGWDPDDWPVLPTDFSYGLELRSTPVVTGVSPAAATAGTNAVEVEVEASPLDAEATLELGPGVTVVSSGVEGGRLLAVVDISPDAPAGARDVIVTNPGSEPGVLEAGFEVLAAPAPRLDRVEPRELARGATAVLVVHGAGLLPGAAAVLGAGIEVTGAEVLEGTRLVLTVSVAGSAQPGPRPLSVANPGGASATLEGAVTVLAGDEAGCACRGAGPAPARGAAPALLLAVFGLGLARLTARR